LTPHGTGVSPFHPLAVALAAGANFIARCFAGDPNGTARVITEAVRHPGFSMVQVLSPCVTYQPEQREWKNTVRKADIVTTSEADLAARWLMADDGLSTGVMYKGHRPVYRPELEETASVADLEKSFVV